MTTHGDSSQTRRLLLLFCPVWDLQSPYTSGAYLIAAARHLARVDYWDLNAELQDSLLSDESLSAVSACLECRKNPALAQRAKLLGRLVIGRVDRAKQVLRAEISEAAERQSANCILICARELASIPYYPARFTGSEVFLTQKLRALTLAEARNALSDRTTNIFLDAFCKKCENRIHLDTFDFVGASIAGAEQILPTLSILKRIKEIDPKVRIVIGGAMLPYLQESVRTERRDFLACRSLCCWRRRDSTSSPPRGKSDATDN